MPCNHYGNLTICAPRDSIRSVLTTTCLDCKQRTRMLCFFQEWYGWDKTCLKCGRSWSDGYWMPLDFVPQSRQRSINSAKRRWRRGKALEQDE